MFKLPIFLLSNFELLNSIFSPTKFELIKILLKKLPLLKLLLVIANLPLKFEATKTGLVSEKEFDKIVDPKKMTYPG